MVGFTVKVGSANDLLAAVPGKLSEFVPHRRLFFGQNLLNCTKKANKQDACWLSEAESNFDIKLLQRPTFSNRESFCNGWNRLFSPTSKRCTANGT
jgi:hypothetical protein